MTETKKVNNKRLAILQLLMVTGILIFLNILGNGRVNNKPLFTSFDLTQDKRYTLTEATRRLLSNLDDVVYINVLLDGALPAGIKRLQKSTQEMLDDFRSVSGYVEYNFGNPTATGNVEQDNAMKKQLAEMGVVPTNLRVKTTTGNEQKSIYPYAMVYYKGRNYPVNLLENEIPGVSPEWVLNNAVNLLEYKFANALQKLSKADQTPAILFTTGHGELTPRETADWETTLRKHYNTGRLHLDSIVGIDPEVKVLVVAKPLSSFSEPDKFKIDQYVMHGGKVLWLLDKMTADLDSLAGKSRFVSIERDLQLDELLFNYGIRIDPALALDLQCSKIELVTGKVGNAPQFTPFPYPYHLVSVTRQNHPIVNGLGPVNLLFASLIDTTVRTKLPLQKTALLQTSDHSRFQLQPIELDFEILREDLIAEKFNKKDLTLAVLLEGTFSSLYEHRVTPGMLAGLQQLNLEFLTQSRPSKMIVVADGDIAKDPVVPGKDGYFPLGYNRFERYTFANKEFLVNAVEYLLDEAGMLEARNRQVALRLLDTVKAKKEAGMWRLINIVAPLLVLVLFGWIFNLVRRKRYAH